MNEFDIIKQFFTSQRYTHPNVVLGTGDDAAIIDVPSDQQLIITTDTLISGVHFPEYTPAADIGHKSLAVNLSDLAAMGATPAWVTLALTLPDTDETWLGHFSQGFLELAAHYKIQLVGGDLTKGSLSITVQAMGLVPKNQAIRRSGAKSGDLIYVTGTLGDAAMEFNFLRNKTPIKSLDRLNRPEPRVEIGEQLRGVASAAIDVSDGLAADLGHILENSHAGARVDIEKIPLSSVMREKVSEEEALAFALNGGDDYELCFTVPKIKQNYVPKNCTCIGEIIEASGLDLRFANGTKYNHEIKGYQHF